MNTTHDQRHDNCVQVNQVSPAASLLLTFFRCPDSSLCGCQLVSAPYPIAFFWCPDPSLPQSSESELPHSVTFFLSSLPLTCSLSFRILHLSLCGPQPMSACIWLLSFHVLTHPSLCGPQLMIIHHSVAFFLCPDLSLSLRSPEDPCLVSSFLFPQVPPSAVSSMFLSVSSFSL